MKDAQNIIRDSIHVMEDFDPSLYENATPPLVSIYMPIEHANREQRRDEWTGDEFKDLMDDAERTLAEKFDDENAWKGIKERMDYLLAHPDAPLWINARAGLAFLMSNTDVFVFDLDFDVEPVVMVGDEYYLKPLLRNKEHLMHYYLLALSTDRFGWIDGNQDHIERVPLPDNVKAYFAETYGEFDGETSALDYFSLEDHHSPYHDHKSRNDVTQEEALKFFRYVNKSVDDYMVRNDTTPIILVTLPEHEAMFRKVCTLRHLLPQAIHKNANQLTGDELRDDAVAILQGMRDEEIKKLTDHYAYEKSKGKASDDIDAIAFALLERKVDTLFVLRGKSIPGSYDAENGTVNFDPDADPRDDKLFDPASPDVVDSLLQAALKQGATVRVLGADQMPTDNYVAAIYRY